MTSYNSIPSPDTLNPDMEYVQVEDISIAYKIYGKHNTGTPLLLIIGYACTMDMWPIKFIDTLSRHYKVIVFNNRGMGATSCSDKEFTIKLFANDTAGLLNKLGICRTHVLGWSMGTFIAQELVLNYPHMVDKLILYSAFCGGEETVMGDEEIVKNLFDISGTLEERIERTCRLLFPPKWLKENPDPAKIFPPLTEIISDDNILRQASAIEKWEGTFDRLNEIKQSTLVITGTDDILIPPENAFIIAREIPGASVIQIKDGGHGAVDQYPEKLANFVITFLQN